MTTFQTVFLLPRWQGPEDSLLRVGEVVLSELSRSIRTTAAVPRARHEAGPPDKGRPPASGTPRKETWEGMQSGLRPPSAPGQLPRTAGRPGVFTDSPRLTLRSVFLCVTQSSHY